MQLNKELLLPYPAILARNLATLAPGERQHSFFCNSGTEAIEGALKRAEHRLVTSFTLNNTNVMRVYPS